jgi:A/G-specific adenine glycosylase
MWEGLGYYNRCKNLLYTAKEIVTNYQGVFPNKFEEIIALKGVGTYTAAAISSFAYNLPYAVVDGNVYRVLSRFLGNTTPIDSKEGKLFFSEAAQKGLDKQFPASYNQAIMDFGATVCKPKLALCEKCPLQKKCIAYETNTVYDLPIKTKKIQIKQRRFLYFIIEHNETILVRKREEKDIWQNLYEFVQADVSNTFITNTKNVNLKLKQIIGNNNWEISKISAEYIQKLSHQKVHAHFVKVIMQEALKLPKYTWKHKKSLQKLPFAAIINDFLKNEKKQFIFDK